MLLTIDIGHCTNNYAFISILNFTVKIANIVQYN